LSRVASTIIVVLFVQLWPTHAAGGAVSSRRRVGRGVTLSPKKQERPMFLKKCILPSLAWWIAISTEVGTLSAIPGLTVPVTFGFDFTKIGLLIHYLLVLAITALATFLVMRRPSNRPSPVLFAATLIGTSLAIDAVVTAPLVVHSYAAYFGKWSVWLGYAMSFACAFLTARAVTQSSSAEAAGVDQHA
jgi:hypothetical protein